MKKFMKQVSIFITCLLILQIFFAIIPSERVSATAPKTQKTMKYVQSQPNGWDGIVWWYQLDDGSFRADFPDGTQPVVAKQGTKDQPYPAEYTKSFSFKGISNWAAAEWPPGTEVSQISNIDVLRAEWDSEHPDITTVGEPKRVGNKEVLVNVTSGGKIPSNPDNYYRYGTSGTTGNPKFKAGYLVPLRLVWQGEVYEEKEIDVNPDSTIQVGKTKQLNASVRTKDFGKTTWGSWNSVASSPSTTWETSNAAIATVSNTGLVTAKSAGTVVIRATWKSGEYEISDAATITVTKAPDPCVSNPSAPGCQPDSTYSVTGDFDILPSTTIKWRDPFELKPKNFQIPSACVYLYHEYRFQKDGVTWTSNRAASKTSNTSFSYSTYPSNLGVGANYIEIRITASCGSAGTIDSGWTAGKYLNITTPTDNHPPQFNAGFFKEYNRTGIVPDYEVVVNSFVNLRIINDNTKNPAWPYDPDGDPIEYTWLFSDSKSSWIRSLPSEYGAWEHDDRFYNLKATELGSHSVKVIARDSFGAESSKTVTINVIPENPIPIINGPTEVKETHPLPKPFDGSKSYSPMGRSISEYIWQNKKDVYTAAGTETIKLDVVDSAGLKSLAPAVHILTVIPDDPPIGVLDVPPLGIRGGTFDIINKSYSPDGDKITSLIYRFKYDANNNGFADDAWQNRTGDVTKTVLQPTKVGKYLFDIKVCEEYGKCAYASDTQPESSRTLDVVNQAPSVSFLVEGKNEIPEPPNSNPGIPASEIISKWSLYETNSTTALTNKPYMWVTDKGKLMAGLGKGMEKQFPFFRGFSYGPGQIQNYAMFQSLEDNGYGPNSLSPYRAMASYDPTRSAPIVVPVKSGYYTTYTTGEDYDKLQPVKFSNLVRTNNQYIYFDQQSYVDDPRPDADSDDNVIEYYIFALNKSKLPPTRQVSEWETSGYYNRVWLNYEWDGPNPYDFILRIPHYSTFDVPYFTETDQYYHSDWYKKAQAGDYSYATGKSKAYSMQLYDFEVTGSRIVAAYAGCVPKYGYYERDSDGDSRSTYPCPTDGDKLMLRIWDAMTGQELPSSLSVGNPSIKNAIRYPGITVKGENIEVYDAGSINEGSYKYVQFDRSGKIVSQGATPWPVININYGLKYRNFWGQLVTPDPTPYTCRFNSFFGQPYKDDKGNTYFLTLLYCSNGSESVNIDYDRSLNPDFPQSAYLIQMKPDHTIGTMAKLSGNQLYRTQAGPYDFQPESDPLVAINPVTNQAIVRIFTTKYCSGCMYPQVGWNQDTVNLTTGAVTPYGGSSFTLGELGANLTIGHNGSFGTGWASNSASGTFDKFNKHAGYKVVMESTTYSYSDYKTTDLRYGEYVGDGMWLSIYNGDTQWSGGGMSQGYTTMDAWMFLDVGTPSATQTVKTFQFGQYVSPAAYTDGEYTMTINMDNPTENSKMAGLSFRMTDPRNRYSLEMDGSKLYLSKYVAGARTVLANIAYPFQPKTDYAFKVVAQGNRIQVTLNGVPYFDVTDNQFTSGKYGPFSDKSYVTFSNINEKDLNAADDSWVTNYAIWENGVAQADVRYTNMVFDDPEKDPMAGNYRWSIQHTPKFLNNQGLSALHGQTLTSPALKFDKVGNYRVTLKAQDDPNSTYPYPSAVFGGYRKWSNDYWQIVTVHRRPIAQFTLSVNSTDHTVSWNDQSYDPDRWQSSTMYDTEATGVDYKISRGVLERKYYYQTPKGATVNSKLVTPTEAGTYKVGLQVKDEYGAWSYWAEQTIDILVPVQPNQPPTPGFTLSKTSLYRGDVLTITSTASDQEDGPAANLPHEYYIRNKKAGGAETLQSTSRGTWTKAFNSIGVMEIRQVVCDSKGQCAQAIKSVTVLNRAPNAAFDWSPVPAFEGDPIAISNRSTDPDGDALTSVWTVNGPGGYAQTGSTRDFTIPGAQTRNHPGLYQVKLTVRDPDGATDTVTRTIEVRELGIQGMVLHTDAWEQNRLRYNEKHPDAPRPPNWFWAGEAFRLAADVTDTGSSATRPLSVEAAASADLKKVLEAVGASRVRWEGLLRSEDAGFPLDELPQGEYTFMFTVVYSNGTVKTSSVTVRLVDTVQQYVRVHRVQ
ncbi:Ig-like domain-containing protein [Cohnella caldifontis]|uniref:Ig-like domain-containing protein n=1 Tax=Cohnella caldifontis TaxID=3027471 RepID=UPI0023ECD94A|nr:Ig-like domain-containing protein [Cohnella sp. YIM B05605]